MKEGWQIKTLGEICIIARGGSPRPIQSYLTTSEDGINWIKIGDTEIGGKYIYRTEEKIIKEGIKRSRFVEEGDFLLSNSMSFGRPYILKTNGCIHDGWLVLKGYENTFSQDFLYYLLSSPNVRQQFEEGARGSTVRNLNTDIVSRVKVIVPPLSEQQRIVEKLDNAFAKIDAMKANAEKKLNEAKMLYNSFLVHQLTPTNNWEKQTLGSLSVLMSDGPFGSNLKKDHYTNNKEVRIIQLSNIGENGWKEENTKYTTFEHLKTISRSEVDPDDIVIAKMMPAGRAIICPNQEAKYVLSSDAVKVKLKKGINNRFILYSINSPFFRNQVYENVTGIGRERTSLTKLRECTINVPTIEEQNNIVKKLDCVYNKIEIICSMNNKIVSECDALKQSLLRKAFNGEL